MTHPPLIETDESDRQIRARDFPSDARSQPRMTLDTYLWPPLVSIRPIEPGWASTVPPQNLGAIVESTRCATLAGGFSRCGRAQKMMPNKGKDQRGPVALPTGPATIFVALTRLSLVGLHPCRAQLRFTGQLYHSSSFTCPVRIHAGAYRAGDHHGRNRSVNRPYRGTAYGTSETLSGSVELVDQHNRPVDFLTETARWLTKKRNTKLRKT